MHGPSGCGKTVLARGLATAFPALNVLEVRGTALFSPLVGEAEAALRDVVKRVRPFSYLVLADARQTPLIDGCGLISSLRVLGFNAVEGTRGCSLSPDT